jgi:internalin A
MLYDTFVDWCANINSLSPGARHTVKVLLKRAATESPEEAQQILCKRKELDLGRKGLTDLTPLRSFVNLTKLYLHKNEITDITGIDSLINLEFLGMADNQISDISKMKSLINLTWLSLGKNKITDISVLGLLKKLQLLEIEDNEITDINSLQSITDIEVLNLNNNLIHDINVLKFLKSLTTLKISGNKITDISVLTNLQSLEILNVCSNQITDISPLRSIKLRRIDFHSGNPIKVLPLPAELDRKRLNIATKPIEVDRVKRLIKITYKLKDLKEPQIFICTSPRDAYCRFFKTWANIDDLRGFSQKSNKKDLGQSISLTWLDDYTLTEFANSNINTNVWNYEVSELEIQPEADDALNALIYSKNFFEAFSSNDTFDVYHALTPLDLLKKIHLMNSYTSSSEIDIPKRLKEAHYCRNMLFENCGWIFAFEKICIVCDRPLHLRFDSENRLHGEGLPAIEFADGWNLYFHHGIKIPG